MMFWRREVLWGFGNHPSGTMFLSIGVSEATSKFVRPSMPLCFGVGSCFGKQLLGAMFLPVAVSEAWFRKSDMNANNVL